MQVKNTRKFTKFFTNCLLPTMENKMNLFLALFCASLASFSYGLRSELKHYRYSESEGIGASNMNFSTTTYLPRFNPYTWLGIQDSIVYTQGFWFFFYAENYGSIGKFLTGSQRFSAFTNSFRFAGYPEDYSAPSLTFYTALDYQGDDFKIYSDEPELNFPSTFLSIFITTEPFTLYSGKNFTGTSLCLVPTAEHWENPSLLYGLANVIEFEGYPRPISSIQKGCSPNAENIIQLPVLKKETM